MLRLAFSILFLVLCIISNMLLCSVSSGYSWSPSPPIRQIQAKFNQKVNRFWEFDEQSNTWVEVSLPFSLVSCVNGSCKKVGSIERMNEKFSTPEGEPSSKITDSTFRMNEKKHEQVLPVRKGISLSRMSETSVWFTGQSGAIYERFWNGVNWVIAPHNLPTSAGSAVSIYFVNQTILALSESGVLFQLQLNENSQPIWNELVLVSEESTSTDREPVPTVRMKTGVASSDGERLYLCTKNGSLVEIIQFLPLRWNSHGHPPGGDVSAVVDTGTIRPGILFTVSSSGDLYEFDDKSKPSWRKHIWNEESTKTISLKPDPGHAIYGLGGSHSASLFLLSKDGLLIERRLQKRKWKWVVHGNPKDHYLSAITSAQQGKQSEHISSLFCTTTTGNVFEYQLSMHSGNSNGKQTEAAWINHKHPSNAKVAQGVQGVEVHAGRLMFHLDDGRPAELHFPGLGGEQPPTHLSGLRRKASNKYEWTILEAPETEGWNAEYCSDERGPFNCMEGASDSSAATSSSRRWKAQKHEHYIHVGDHKNVTAETYNFLTASITNNFRMRMLHPDRSFFYVTDDGLTFEYLQTDNAWIWLRHEHPTAMASAVGSYNGSIFLVDGKGNLLMRERSDEGLSWMNCTAMRKGKQVATGPPWDEAPIKGHRVTAEDALFFVSKDGMLLEFTVAQQQFKWKDCGNPPETRIAYVVDQEAFRANIVFVVGRNGHLYQYNRITELWHKHYQSPHLVLSRTPGTAIRPSSLSLTGSIFMLSEDGGLIEYHFDATDGWEWVEHGTPCRDVSLIGAPGPCFDSIHLFVVGTDGNAYRRHLEHGSWRWTSHGHPQVDAPGSLSDHNNCATGDGEAAASHESGAHHQDLNCNEKVAPVRPIAFSENSVVFELQDGRLAELQRFESETDWRWARIIGTPTSPCLTGYWTAVAT